MQEQPRAGLAERPPRPGASPGLLRRRYSVPETVMRKYKLAQLKSDSEDSEAGSAPSPRGASPLRGRGAGPGRGPRAALLRRLWGRGAPVGGSHAELRYCDAERPRSPCAACRRPCDPATPPTPPKSSSGRSSRSPKRLYSGGSPERYIARLESARDALAREARQRRPASPVAGSCPSERSSFKSASLSEGSPKLGLSSLATSSYPANDGPSTSEISGDITRSSASCSSGEAARPLTAGDSPTGRLPPEERRQSASNPSGESGLSSFNKNSPHRTAYSENDATYESSDSPSKTITETASSQPTTSSSEKTTTTETPSETATSTDPKETTSSSDSAMSTRTADTTDDSKREDNEDSRRSSPSTTKHTNDTHDTQHRTRQNNAVELSDTGISETVDNDFDSNKNSVQSFDELDQPQSQPGSTTYSEDCSSGFNSDMVTCIENSITEKVPTSKLTYDKFECLEVVVSETLSSSAFELQNNKDKHIEEKYLLDDANLNNNVHTVNKDYPKKICNKIDIDQYVSNILIDSLNSMTEQINEINCNNDDDIKLNILEKEIKVKLQSVCPSPINLSTNAISTLLTNMPDKDLLETTIIEEKSRSLAYTTETKIFPLENTSEIREKRSTINVDPSYQELLEEEFFMNNNMGIGSDVESRSSGSHIPLANVVYEEKNIQELLNNNIEANAQCDSKQNDFKEDDDDFYLLNASISSDGDHKHESDRDSNSQSVLKQLHKIFENNSRVPLESLSTDIDTNFNFCADEQPSAYFCDTVYRNTSHLEMSTDVDVFVDNSLNKMMNSIELEYNASDLCTDIENMSFNNNVDKLEVNLENKSEHYSEIEKSKENVMAEIDLDKVTLDKKAQKNTNLISNVGTGSQYLKLQQAPLLVPRFSAIPHSQSMEVNTSSDDDVSECESDCISLVDSLDDPSSPRLPIESQNKKKNISNHDKKLVRGDIMLLLPENTKEQNEMKSPREKSEMFFVPIKEDVNDCTKENIVVAEHMPEKIKEKLIKRQQKRELRKEHYKRKKMKQLKKELEKQKDAESKKLKEEHEKDCVEIISLLIDQVAHKVSKEEKRKTDKDPKISPSLPKKSMSTIDKKVSLTKKPLLKTDRVGRKEDLMKDFESFTVDKQGNIQMKKSKKMLNGHGDSSKGSVLDNTKLSDSERIAQHFSLNNIEHIPYEAVKSKREYDYHTPRFDTKLTGPRRLYQKTEFKEGNKHVEILEIVECLSSSPETPSDDSQEFPSKKYKRSKIPVLVNEKNNKISKNKSNQKYSKTCRSPINKNNPMNISMAKVEQKYNKAGNSKMDQLIANILIDAFNEDNPDNRRIQLVSSPRDRKATEITIKRLPAPSQIPSRRASIPQQHLTNHEKVPIVPKYTRKFDAIPEERSSMSVESSNEDINNVSGNRRTSLPAEIKMVKDNKQNSPRKSPESNEKTILTTINNDSHIISNNESKTLDTKRNLMSIDENTVPNVSENNLNDEHQSNKEISKSKVMNNDMSTSPIPQYISTATSPIPTSIINVQSNTDENTKHIKGKKALGKKEGWAGFCRPQTSFSPEHEGFEPSSNNPSVREVFEKIDNKTKSEKNIPIYEKIAPPSQRILRTMDSRNNIRQISIHHEVTTKTEKTAKLVDTIQIINSSQTENIQEKTTEQRSKHSSKTHTTEDFPSQAGDSDRTIKSNKVTQLNNPKSKSISSKKANKLKNPESNQSDSSFASNQTKVHKSESRDSFDKKTLRLPSPFRHQSSTHSSESSSSGSDSEAGVNCPVLVPRWPPAAAHRQRRNVARRPQKAEEPFKLPYQNVAGGWSVTLAGSCYTMLPSDVEMKVSFPKTVQTQVTSQSDSGLGDERNLQKNSSVLAICKKCGNRENFCLNCKTTQNCKCIAPVINKKGSEHSNESFLPPAQMRKVISSSHLDSSESTEQGGKSAKKYYQYLPDVNGVQGSKNKTKKSLKMARRFSLHCWLPEDKLPGKTKVAKMEISECMMPQNEDELSVMGCAIMPEIKPRVPTMSERDLTRVQTAQFYSRNRHL